MVGCCECGNELYASIKTGSFLRSRGTINLPRRSLRHEVKFLIHLYIYKGLLVLLYLNCFCEDITLGHEMGWVCGAYG